MPSRRLFVLQECQPDHGSIVGEIAMRLYIKAGTCAGISIYMRDHMFVYLLMT